MMKLLKKIFSYIIFISIDILKKFGLNVYFVTIQASRIGHLLNNIDQSIYYLNKKHSSYILLINLNGKISNQFLVKCWKINNNIYFTKITKIIISLAGYNKMLHKQVLCWKHIQPKFTKLFSSKPNLILDEKRILINNNDKNLLKKKFICLHNRDNKYTNNINFDHNYLEYKNFKFDDFNSTINRAKKDNLLPVRIGNFTEKNYFNKNLKIEDRSGKRSSEHMDLLLQSYSKFTIIGQTGLSAVNSTLRKPQLYINFTPFTLDQLSWVSKFSMVIPKLFFSKKKNRILKFSEMLKIDFDIHQTHNFLKKKNLIVLDNSKEEILKSYMEMNYFIDNRSHNDKNHKLNKKFFKIFKDNKKADFLFNKNKIRISTFFLEKYSSLF